MVGYEDRNLWVVFCKCYREEDKGVGVRNVRGVEDEMNILLFGSKEC